VVSVAPLPDVTREPPDLSSRLQLPPAAVPQGSGPAVAWVDANLAQHQTEATARATLRAVRTAYDLAGQRRQSEAVVYYLV
jgi:hypothetical protein